MAGNSVDDLAHGQTDAPYWEDKKYRKARNRGEEFDDAPAPTDPKGQSRRYQGLSRFEHA